MALQEKLIDGIGSLGWTINIWSPERKLTNGSSVRKTVREVGGRKGYNIKLMATTIIKRDYYCLKGFTNTYGRQGE